MYGWYYCVLSERLILQERGAAAGPVRWTGIIMGNISAMVFLWREAPQPVPYDGLI